MVRIPHEPDVRRLAIPRALQIAMVKAAIGVILSFVLADIIVTVG